MDLESISMQIVATSGDAKAKAFEALNEARNGNFLKADQILKDSEKSAVKAYKAQNDLLSYQADGNDLEPDLLLIHAEDHLMTTMLAQELIKEMIEMYKDRGN